MRYDRDYTPAAYGVEYTRNVRWKYRTRYGKGTDDSPYRGGGSVGRGYGRATDLGFERPYRGGWDAREAEYAREFERGAPTRRRGRGRRQGAPARGAARGRDVGGMERRPARGRPRRGARPGTAARSRDRAYPYFGSAAAMEAASGYPPGDSLNPEIPVAWRGPDPSFYDDEY